MARSLRFSATTARGNRQCTRLSRAGSIHRVRATRRKRGWRGRADATPFSVSAHRGSSHFTATLGLIQHAGSIGGEINVYGHDVQTSEGREAVRRIMGVCPQHDVLYDRLTVQEHLELFGLLKGLTGDVLERAVETGMKEVHLDVQSKVASESLSGGQKRKLSVALALIGDPKMVCLDECVFLAASTAIDLPGLRLLCGRRAALRSTVRGAPEMQCTSARFCHAKLRCR